MRRRTLSLALTLFLPVVVAGCLGGGPRALDERVLQAAAVADTPLEVVTRNGSVTVSVDPAATAVSIEARITAGGHDEDEAQARAQATEVRADRAADGALHVAVAFPGGARNGDGCSLAVVVPSLSAVAVRTDNGAIRVRGTRGTATLTTSNGAVSLAAHDGDAVVRASNGGVDVEAVTGGVDVETSNGGVDLTAVGGAVTAETSNGRIDLVDPGGRAQPFRLVTSNGRVGVELGSGTRARIRCSTSNGSISFQGAGDAVVTGSSRDKTIVLGGGGPDCEVETSNGSVSVRVGS